MQVTLTNTDTEPSWFNNSARAINFPTGANRNNLNYSVQWELASESGGDVGDVLVTGKQLNGFTIAYTGGAKSVALTLYIQGGLW
jgi:hypothetical protein